MTAEFLHRLPDFPSLEIRTVEPFGKGLFAHRPFNSGEVVFALPTVASKYGKIVTIEESCQPDCNDYSMSVFPGRLFCPTKEFPFYFLNHSCTPNVSVADFGLIKDNQVRLTALKPISQGEQIFLDYSAITTLGEGGPQGEEWVMECGCGSPNCRHVISDFLSLWKRDERQARSLVSQGAVPSFLLEMYRQSEPKMLRNLLDLDKNSEQKYREALRSQEFAASQIR